MRLFYLCPLLLFLFSSEIKAQTNEPQSISISISAQIAPTIELFTVQTVDFRYEDMEQNILAIDPVLNPSAGKMVARGAPDMEIRINFLQSRELVNNETNHVLFFEYFVAGNELNEQETSELLQPDNRSLSFNADGEFYIWVGGRVDLSTAEPGRYEGEFSIEIEYI